jgi:N-acyl-L-homoserine lactone synthetase
MVTLADSLPDPVRFPPLREMFEARKRVFVDLLRWDVPVLEGRYEVDQFDDEHAVYLIVADEQGRHAGSARLLKSTRPHILDTLFPDLCASAPPRGPDIVEITRGSHASAPTLAQAQHRVATLKIKRPTSALLCWSGRRVARSPKARR